MSPYQIAGAGIGYVPQGRRIRPSLSTHDHLAMVGAQAGPRWKTDKIYVPFLRLGERRNVGASNLSGGEQQMLAIGRALSTNPALLVMDEPSEGLATALAQHVLVTVNGRVAADPATEELLADEDTQNLYLGIA